MLPDHLSRAEAAGVCDVLKVRPVLAAVGDGDLQVPRFRQGSLAGHGDAVGNLPAQLVSVGDSRVVRDEQRSVGWVEVGHPGQRLCLEDSKGLPHPAVGARRDLLGEGDQQGVVAGVPEVRPDRRSFGHGGSSAVRRVCSRGTAVNPAAPRQLPDGAYLSPPGGCPKPRPWPTPTAPIWAKVPATFGPPPVQ